MRSVRTAAAVLCLAALTIQAPASAAPTWAPAASAAIRPGARTTTANNACTANFVFYDSKYVYIGQAAHCASQGTPLDTDGCSSPTMPVGTKVTIAGAASQGTLVYSSWVTMQARKETNADLCAYNDFALIRLAAGDAAKVNPSVPFWGGPTGLASGSSFGGAAYGYGNSSLWLGIGALRPHQGFVVGQRGGGRAHKVYTAPPGVPGDSGSAYLDRTGKALGVLSTMEAYPLAASNDLADLRLALDYMRAHTTLRVTLANGTEPFTG